MLQIDDCTVCQFSEELQLFVQWFTQVCLFFFRGYGQVCAIMRLLVHLNFLHFAFKRQLQCELSNSTNQHLFHYMCHFCCNVHLQIEPQEPNKQVKY